MRMLLIFCLLWLNFVLPKASAQTSDKAFFDDLEQKRKAWIGKPFPSFSFPGSSGRVYSEKDLIGKTTIVDIWELGCIPCMFSIKYFNAIHDSLKRAGYQLFSMIRNDWPECLQFIRQENAKRDYMMPNYEVISMGSAKQTQENISAAKELNSQGWPFFIIVDSKGIVREVNSGFAADWSDVHAERPTNAPYSNRTIQWMMSALKKAKMIQ